MSKTNIGSCSSRVEITNDAGDVDVKGIDIEGENDLMEVSTKRTEQDKINDSAEEFLLTRESVIRFVEDSITNAVDRQKRNADKHGRANVHSFKINDL